ncbi:MAG: GGDEF domain-containing protein [Burkholderiales bacterium]
MPDLTQTFQTPIAPLTTEQKQAVRMRRFLLATLTYVVAAILIALVWAFGLMPGTFAVVTLAAMAIINVALYATFRSGLNLRFADPSLTRAQIFIALTLQMYIIYHLDSGRGLALVFTFIVFLFGVYRLNRRGNVTLILYTLAAYALVINLLMHFRPETIQNVYLEWFSWLLLAFALPWFGMLGGQISELRYRLRVSHAELAAAFDTIRKMATRDNLTGLHNRAALTDSLQHALAQGARHGRRIAVFFMDLDHFKKINDTLGHDAGDRVLCEVAARLRRSVRAADLVARLGGDEFVVVVEGFKEVGDLEIVARKIVDLVGQPLLLDEHELTMSVSCGVAASPHDGHDVESLLRNGDAAMYHAKQQGRNGYAMYSEQMRSRASA